MKKYLLLIFALLALSCTKGKIGDPKTNHLRLVLPGNANGQIPAWSTLDSKYHPGGSVQPQTGIINACTSGLVCDWNTNLNITATNGSVDVTSSDTPWTGADVGKLIRIDDPPNGVTSRNTFIGTIASFVSTSHITISATYPGVNTGQAQAMWGTDNFGTPWNTLQTAIQGAMTVGTVPAAAQVYLSKPIMTSGTLEFDQKSVNFFGDGTTNLFDPGATGSIVWAGAAANTTLLLSNCLGSNIHDFMLLGSTLAPPFLIREENVVKSTPNANNKIYNIVGGGLQNLGLGPDEGDGDQLGAFGNTACTAAGTPATCCTGSGTGTCTSLAIGGTQVLMTAAPTGLQPNATVRFYDPTSAGGGTEVSRTTTTYVAGSNPVILRTALGAAHTAANTAVVWSKPAALAGLTFGIPASTQNDDNFFENVKFYSTDACLYLDRTPGTAQTVNMRGTDLTCKNFSIGVDMANNGSMDIGNIQLIAGFSLPASPGIDLHVGGGGQLHVHQLNTEFDSCNVLGTNYVFVNGTTNEGSGSGGSTVTVDDLITNVSSCMPANGDIVESTSDATAYMNFTLNSFKFVNTADTYQMAANVNPRIHLRVRAGASGQRTVKVNQVTSIQRLNRLQVVDDGSTSPAYVRDVELVKAPAISGQQPDHFHAIYQGQQTTVLGQSDVLSPHGIGGLTVDQLTPNTPVATCIGGASGEDYYYVETSVDATGNASGASGLSTAVNCNVALNATTDYLNVQAGVSIGAVSYNIYQAHVTTGNPVPALSSFGFIGNIPNNIIDTSVPRTLLCTALETPTSCCGGVDLAKANAQCTANLAPYTCCTGLHTGTCDTAGQYCSNPLPPTLSDIGTAPGAAPPSINVTGTTTLNGPAYVAQAPTQIGTIQSYGRSVGQSTVANAPSYARQVISTTPGGYWKMDTAGPDLPDSSGNSNTAVGTGHNTSVNYNQPGLIFQDLDTAVTMPGSGTPYFIVSPDATHLPTASIFTVIGTFKRAATNPTAGQALIGQKSGGFLILFPTNSDQLVFRQAPSTNIYCSGVNVSDTTLAHWFAVRYNGSKASIVLDGKDVTTSCGNNVTLAPADSTLFIGLESAAGSQNANGTLDEFAVYNTYLSDSTIQTLYQSWAGIKYGTWNWFTDGQPNTECPVSSGGTVGCMGLYRTCGWSCKNSLVPTPTPTPTPTPSPTPT